MYNLSKEANQMLKILGTKDLIKNEIEEAISNSINYSSLKTITINYLESEEKTTIKKSDISLYKVEQIGNSLYLRFMDIKSKCQSIDIKYIETIKDGRKCTLWSYKQVPNTEIKQIIPNKKISNTNFDKYYIVIVNNQVQDEYRGIGIKGNYIGSLYIPNDFVEIAATNEHIKDLTLDNAVQLILNDNIDNKQLYKKVDKLINDNLHLIINKKKIISKLDNIRYRILYGQGVKKEEKINNLNTSEIAENIESNNNTEVENMNYNEKLRKIFNTEDYYSIIEKPINGKLCKDYSKEELFILFDENNIKYDKTAPKENLFLFLLDWIAEGDEMSIIEDVIINNTKENHTLNFIDLNSTHKQLITIEGDKVIIKHLIGSAIWKTTIRDIIKDFGHKNTNEYIKHLKKFGYKEIKDISIYKEDDKITNSEDPQIEKWNNKLNTTEKINHQLEVLKRVVLKRKKESPNLEPIPCNGYIISKILQTQGFKCQFKRPQYDKCYYDIENSNNDFIRVIFKDKQDNKEYYKINCSIENNIKQDVI